jgi:hypothetical protein
VVLDYTHGAVCIGHTIVTCSITGIGTGTSTGTKVAGSALLCSTISTCSILPVPSVADHSVSADCQGRLQLAPDNHSYIVLHCRDSVTRHHNILPQAWMSPSIQ